MTPAALLAVVATLVSSEVPADVQADAGVGGGERVELAGAALDGASGATLPAALTPRPPARRTPEARGATEARAASAVIPPDVGLSGRERPGVRGIPSPRRSALVPALEVPGLNLGVMAWNKWVGEAGWAHITLSSIERNARSEWVYDNDQFWVNQFGHPYQGTFPHTAARSAGLSFWEALPFGFIASLAWELAGETERPSINDQVTTTVGGAVVGEVVHRLSLMLLGDGRNGWREAGSALLTPMTALNRRIVGLNGVGPAEPVRWELALGGAVAKLPWENPGGAAATWDRQYHVGYELTHGVPWEPSFQLDGPFDHFNLVASYDARSDPHATLLARGLLLGRTYAARDLRGVWGLYAQFDLDTPGVFRASTSALGVGTTAGGAIGSALGVEGTAILSAVLMGGVGQLDRSEPTQRDYRFGPGAQSVLEGRITAWDRAQLRVGARHYLVVGQDIGGTELIGSASAAALVRVAGEHGLGVEGTLATRRVWASDAGFEQSGHTIRVFYVLSGFHAPAARVEASRLGAGDQG